MSKQVIIRPGDEYKGMYFSPGGMSISRADGAVIAVSEKGRALEFCKVHLPHNWANGMLRTIEQLAAAAGNSPMDYFLSCPFTISGGDFVVTTEMVSTHANEIEVIEACAYKVGNQWIPEIVKGKITQVQKQVVTITTFGSVVMYIDVLTGQVMLQIDVTTEVEKEFQSMEILDIVAAARKTVSKENYKIGNKVVFPKVRRDSRMTINVLEFLEQTFSKYAKAAPQVNRW